MYTKFIYHIHTKLTCDKGPFQLLGIHGGYNEATLKYSKQCRKLDLTKQESSSNTQLLFKYEIMAPFFIYADKSKRAPAFLDS